MEKIVDTKCLQSHGACIFLNSLEKFLDAFYNCSAVEMDNSKEWLKGSSRPSHCPQVISGCVGNTFPASVFSEDGCSQQCISCSRKSELAFPSAPEVETLTASGISLAWDKVDSNLYGDALPSETLVSYESRLILKDGSTVTKK